MTVQAEPFSKDVLHIDPARETDRICAQLREILAKKLHRRGLVVGLSGGIDSSVTAALAARALGPTKVLALLMPEKHSAEESQSLGQTVAETYQISYVLENISSILEAVGFYRRYDEGVRKVIPEYGQGWKSKIVITNVFEKKAYNVFSIVAQDPEGQEISKRLPLKAYLEVVAATNFKQRTRKMLEYYHADRLNYAVAGTPNRLEFDQGFFVKLGDGAADVKPIAHLYKTQVYQLADYLGVPEEVSKRPPTTDTYSLPQGQDEFYFSLPFEQMDLCLYAKNHNIPTESVAEALGLQYDQIQLVYDDIDAKRSTTRYLHLAPELIEDLEVS